MSEQDTVRLSVCSESSDSLLHHMSIGLPWDHVNATRITEKALPSPSSCFSPYQHPTTAHTSRCDPFCWSIPNTGAGEPLTAYAHATQLIKLDGDNPRNGCWDSDRSFGYRTSIFDLIHLSGVWLG